MDGTGFLLDLPASLLSEPAIVLRGEDGILYFEDFDAPPQPLQPDRQEAQAQPPPAFSKADVETAYEAGRKEGLQAALSDSRLVQDQLRSAATQALADALAADRRTLEQMAAQRANETAQLCLAIIAAAIPHMMTGYGQEEVQAVVAALLPGMRCEPELRVRTHPDSADMVRETLAEHLAVEGTVISVMSDAALREGDVQISWADGGARRDTAQIHAEIRAALQPLNLPTFEDMCCGKRG